MYRSLILIAILVLALGSFADEAMLVTFALSLANGDPKHLTLLYALSMIGGMVASRSGALILPKINERIVLPMIFILQAFCILVFYFVDAIAFAILILSFGLGYLGSLLWTVFLAVLPHYFADNISLANKITQTIKNAGFVFAPSLTGLSFGILGKNLMVVLVGISIFCALLLLWAKNTHSNTQNNTVEPSKYHTITYRDFIKHPTMRRVLFLFTITIALTSALNILIIPYINHQLNLSPFIYGTTLSMMSLGLLISPMALSDFFKKVGQVAGAYWGASCMGIGMLGFAVANWMTGIYIVLVLFISGFLIGVGNGIQNTLMSEFMLQFCGQHSKQLMPHYVLSLQACVLVGFGLTFFVPAVYILPSLFVFGVIVFLCGVLGACYHHRRTWVFWGSAAKQN